VRTSISHRTLENGGLLAYESLLVLDPVRWWRAGVRTARHRVRGRSDISAHDNHNHGDREQPTTVVEVLQRVVDNLRECAINWVTHCDDVGPGARDAALPRWSAP
jgi:hypothetical protein